MGVGGVGVAKNKKERATTSDRFCCAASCAPGAANCACAPERGREGPPAEVRPTRWAESIWNDLADPEDSPY